MNITIQEMEAEFQTLESRIEAEQILRKVGI